MRIAQSSVEMNAERRFSQVGNRGNGTFARTESFMGIANSMYDNRYGTSGGNPDQWLNYGKDGALKTAAVKDGVVEQKADKPTEIQKSLIQQLLERMKNYNLFPEEGTAGGSRMIGSQVLLERRISYQETETTAFEAKGQAVTEDGRTIDFDISLLMSRNYMEYTNVRRSAVTGMLMDPLVINVGSQVTNISDQTFTFDLDSDGQEEEIPTLGAGSGFLAYDANGDGRINDGGELFGAMTGDGFSELAKYDDDGNGWIDENDEIFSKLKVWCKNEKGEDILMDLKAADVGAIFLGSRDSEFSLKAADGSDRAVVRSSGFFLRESGSAGTMQQIDLAVKSSEELSQDQNQPIIYKESVSMVQFVGQNGEQAGSGLTTATREAAEDTDSASSGAKERAEARAERSRELEARRLKKREQKRLLDERFAKRRQEHKELLQRVQENNIEHRMEIRESYEWLQMRRSYNRA